MLEIKLLFLIIVANGAPIVVSDLLRTRFDGSLDQGALFLDRRPIFGSSKTWRGLVSAFLFTIPGALLLGLPWQVGALMAAGAMLGDLFSSFTKRRLSIAPSNKAFGLDQIPESLFPLLLVRSNRSLSALQLGILVVAFIVIELLLSRVLFKLHLRKRPY